ncbi:adenylosuccinate lyase [Achromobacter piechaudii]|uniref:Adenylosuccinate lyase n=1 Tax=Achromobacter piechaudii TaxID=72556 RepID=A0ABM8L3D5_9BURK|nr:adenylosuccinate lyase [Achromobacter piechaudii]CAB3731606.1 Adenylosuccinate lyase [Achromobacter piechaudii]CAB3909619.1 Adenylosuccinate lyase [Achromobacter piechaudii]CAB3954662.1 Adenylosuccinate lyase [Achromobacter piechaudii]
MAVSVFDMQSLQHLWSTDELRGIFSEENRIQKWLDFEAALAEAQAELGIIPADAAKEIRAQAQVANIDIGQMSAEIRRIKHSLVPALKQLQARCGAEHGEWVHYGATTQDVVDTGVALQLKEVHAVILRDVTAVGQELARLAQTHRDTPMAGRTHGVQALPITFGHKCAVWLDELSRHHARLKECEARVMVGMVAGAVGSQASLGEQAEEVERRTLAKLGLDAPAVSWAPARDRYTEYALLLAMLGATLSKIGNELFNMQRNEFGEVEEAFSAGKLGSSTMPHKRNPTSAENLAGLCRPLRANAALMLEGMVQEGERDGIAWKIEWKALPECCLIAGAMLFQAKNLLAGLRVDADAMALNLDRMRGYLLSEHVMLELSERVGKQTAHEWIYEASMHGITNKLDFAQALRQHKDLAALLGEEEIQRLTDPAGYLGQCAASVDRVVSRQQAGWLGA